MSNYYVCHLLITVPPKKSKHANKQNRVQPYQTSVRKSNRKVAHRFIADRGEPDIEDQEHQVDLPGPQTQKKKQKPGRPTRDQKEADQPQSSNQVTPQTIQINDDNPAVAQQQEGPVSRLEFQTLQASMNSMRDMFSSFIGSFTSSDKNIQSNPCNNIPQDSLPNNVIQPVTCQPASTIQQDNNIGPQHQLNQTNDVVNQAIAAHISSIVGPQVTGKPTEAVSYQLDRKVSDTIIQDIWDEKFIDFNNLLEKSDDSDQGLIIKYSQPGEPLTLIPPKGKSQIGSIKQWSQAFDIFHSVYSRKYPQQTHNLLTYASTVKDLAAQGGDYLRYDQEFRRARTRYGIPWEVPENIMWTTCAQSGLKNHVNQVLAGLVTSSPQPSFTDSTPNILSPQSFLDSLPINRAPPPTIPQPTKTSQSPNPPKPNQSLNPITHDDSKIKHPKGFCYHFHNKGKCPNDRCQYIHACWVPGCGKDHSVYVCPDLAKHFNVPIGDSPAPKKSTTHTKTTTNPNRS